MSDRTLLGDLYRARVILVRAASVWPVPARNADQQWAIERVAKAYDQLRRRAARQKLVIPPGCRIPRSR